MHTFDEQVFGRARLRMQLLAMHNHAAPCSTVADMTRLLVRSVMHAEH